MNGVADRTEPMVESLPEAIDAGAARARQRSGVPLLDIRTDAERAAGGPDGAIGVEMDALLADPSTHLSGVDAPALLICARGRRSLTAARRLRDAGYEWVASVTGGVDAWRAADLPETCPEGFDERMMARYARHISLPQVGIEGQARLRDARVVVVGAGGLGSPVALYLAAAGVGHLGIIDDDVVERSNLQRQVLHDDAAVGSSKTDSAQRRLRSLNPDIRVTTDACRVDDDNAIALLSDWDVVIDGSDNFPTRFALNAASIAVQRPLIYGAVERFAGQVGVFHPRGAGGGPCYRCVFPVAPGPDEAPDCATAGVLGVLPGVVGSLQAAEALKWLLQLPGVLLGRILHIDLLSPRFRISTVRPDPECPACGRTAR